MSLYLRGTYTKNVLSGWYILPLSKQTIKNNRKTKKAGIKMNKTISIHSYKGGTGKTTISANLAYAFAKKGINVCIIDLDFKAPSLHTIFNIPAHHKHVEFVNDVL